MNIQRLFSESIQIRTFQKELLADMDTPVSSYYKSGAGEHSFLLESMGGDGANARHSVIGMKPLLVFKRFADRTEITESAFGEQLVLKQGDPFDQLKSLLKAFRFENRDPFECGFLCGYISYDAIRYIERIPATTDDDLNLPEMQLILPSEIILFDNFSHTLKLIIHYEDTGEALALVQAGQQRLAELVEKFTRQSPQLKSFNSNGTSSAVSLRSNIKRDAFEASVRQAKAYIRNGDVFQVVLSRRMQTDVSCEAFDIYRMLHLINPSPYMYFLNFGEAKIVGSSPEILVRYDGQRVLLRPIAGTRRRGQTEAEDRAIAAELLADEKERAEHIMLVDLARNDVGRIASYGSVRRDAYMQVENYSHVMHIVSTVSGELRPEFDAIDAFKACFPAGTVSGAPKVRAMEIIDELENTRRGPYAGAIGYFDTEGRMDTCITIRTLLLKGQTAYWQAGAGIVSDSDPASEYEEAEHKARALLKAISLAEENQYDRSNR